MKKEKTRKRFTIVLIAMFSLMILPIVYTYLDIAIDLQKAVLTGLIAVCSLYLSGQSISDAASNWGSK